MQKINYQLETDKIIKNLDGRKKLLMHSCCAPCSSYCLEYLSEYFDITVFYYNPNIYPPEEYEFRACEQKRFIESFPFAGKVEFIEQGYDSDKFYEAVKGLENEPEGGKRCHVCYRLRLSETALLAKKLGFDYFTTTLSISPHKNSQILNEIGAEIAEKTGVSYLFSDFKKRGGFKRSTEISAEYGIYRQNYCGCIFSMHGQ